MREIKFRAWDIKKQKWIYFRIDKFPSEPQTIEIPKQVKIQFSTGLKDNNGKEIYEGDIILTDQVVEWVQEDSARFDKEYECYGIQDGKYSLSYYKDSEDFKVIGNIYENPELLK